VVFNQRNDSKWLCRGNMYIKKYLFKPHIILVLICFLSSIIFAGCINQGDQSPLKGLSGKIAFVSNRGEGKGSHIWVMNADSSDQHALTKGDRHDSSPSWSPDGKRIAFSSDRDGSLEVFTINADGSEETRLTSSQGGQHRPFMVSGRQTDRVQLGPRFEWLQHDPRDLCDERRRHGTTPAYFHGRGLHIPLLVS
jgi:dipeptidyl aminopeptidase/acylaminoacyl peptidase